MRRGYGELIKTRAFQSWKAMKIRISLRPEYADVSIDPRWMDFKVFYAEMGDRPPGTTLDRIEGSKGYCADNCRWATPLEQTLNRCVTRYLTINGTTRPLSEWAKSIGVSRRTMHHRMAAGWTDDQLLSPASKTSLRVKRGNGAKAMNRKWPLDNPSSIKKPPVLGSGAGPERDPEGSTEAHPMVTVTL